LPEENNLIKSFPQKNLNPNPASESRHTVTPQIQIISTSKKVNHSQRTGFIRQKILKILRK